MPELTMGSLFDGIGVFPLAASQHGIVPVWASEIVPDGLYAYDLYESCDTGNFCHIAPLIVVNHGGTVLVKEPIDFGGADRINLTEDTSPNFLGGAMRVHDFMAASLDELRQYSEEPQLGGM